MTSTPAKDAWRLPNKYPQHNPSDAAIIEALDNNGIRATDDIADQIDGQHTLRFRLRRFIGQRNAPGAALFERWRSTDNGQTWTLEYSDWSILRQPTKDDEERAAILAAILLSTT